MPDWTWILVVVGVLALAIVVARVVVRLSPPAGAEAAVDEVEPAGETSTDSPD